MTYLRLAAIRSVINEIFKFSTKAFHLGGEKESHIQVGGRTVLFDLSQQQLWYFR